MPEGSKRLEILDHVGPLVVRKRIAVSVASARWIESIGERLRTAIGKAMMSVVETARLPDDDLMPHEKRVRCWFRRAHPRVSADLEWTPNEGSIFVRIYDLEGMTASETTFDQTLDGMKAAMATIVKRFA